MSNPTYGQGSDPTATGGSGTGTPEPYASDQPISTDPYTDVPPADVSYGTVDQPYSGSYDESSSSSSTKDVAKGQAGAVKDTAVGAGKNVASTARDEAVNVVSQAGSQAKNLLSTVTDEVRSQGRTQQSRLAEAVHSVSQELGSMGAKSEQSGPVADLVQQASRKTGEVGHWLENKEPGEVLEDVRSFARRRPAMFLGLSALAGVVVGRLGRGAVAANTSVGANGGSRSYDYDASSYSTTPATYGTTVPDTGYGTGYDTGSYSGDTTATGPSIGGYAGGTIPESGGGYAGDEGQPPYGGQGDLNR
ncbi:MAG TPA: hypothetical protein VNT27_04580 [Propionibacteriaceae bacterium]|nr:hypothetical protein [Propionibacteriaceae bacterium]